MQAIHDILRSINSVLWGPPILLLILGTGLYLSFGVRFITLRKIGYAFGQLFKGRHAATSQGDITPFNALMTSLSATVGTGNIAGVATAIALGGPGALFWMWCTALVGMATKYSEAVLAVRFRETDEQGRYVGGPMYYIKNGLGQKWVWLGVAFAIFGGLAGFGIGNLVQANSVADVLHESYGVPRMTTGIVMAILAGLVIIGGIKRIATVVGKLVPVMALAYLAAGLWILATHLPQIPAAIALVVDSAFTGHAAGGGFAGASVWMAIRFGVARGVFSNEAGLGSAPIAHAAAQTNNPVQQGTIAMLGTFIDTLVLCSVTGLAIVLTGVWNNGDTGAPLAAAAFELGMPFGRHVVSLGLAIFAFTTILGWSYYSERCLEFLFGIKIILPFRIVWILVIPLGALWKLGLVWSLADVLNGLMAIPNLLALLLLSPVVFKLTRDYFSPSDNSSADTSARDSQ
jgi:AGCS family alanine or glycine:cation symporter